MPLYWYFYLVRCCDHTLYPGVTTDLDRSVTEHNAGTASSYTRLKRPVRLVHWKRFRTKSAAEQREAEFKKLPKHQKEVLVLGARGARLNQWHDIETPAQGAVRRIVEWMREQVSQSLRGGA